MLRNKLKAKIIERGLDIESLASLINTSRSSMYRMLNDPKKITIEKAIHIKEALKMTNEEASAIFFG